MSNHTELEHSCCSKCPPNPERKRGCHRHFAAAAGSGFLRSLTAKKKQPSPQSWFAMTPPRTSRPTKPRQAFHADFRLTVCLGGGRWLFVDERGGNRGVLVKTEMFDDYGGWLLDSQFMDRMGSPFLLAHGLGEPVRHSQPAAGARRSPNHSAPFHFTAKVPGPALGRRGSFANLARSRQSFPAT